MTIYIHIHLYHSYVHMLTPLYLSRSVPCSVSFSLIHQLAFPNGKPSSDELNEYVFHLKDELIWPDNIECALSGSDYLLTEILMNIFGVLPSIQNKSVKATRRKSINAFLAKVALEVGAREEELSNRSNVSGGALEAVTHRTIESNDSGSRRNARYNVCVMIYMCM